MMMNTKIDKKELRKISRNWILGSQLSWNYERMMGSGYLYAMLPVLKNCTEKMIVNIKICLECKVSFLILPRIWVVLS